MQSETVPKKVVVLAGGVGGARMARGFGLLDDVELTVVVNVGDDDRILGVHVSADLDTVVYTLAGVAGEQGWGRADDRFTVLDEMARFGADTGFRLGDLDLAVNLYRTDRLAAGVPLSEITAAVATGFGVRARVLPVTDDPVRTRLLTDAGWLDFQTYFVRRRHRDRVRRVEFTGIDLALPAPGVIEAITSADLVVVAPSNPVLSIWPILGVAGIKHTVARKRVMAVSPLIGGKAVKGPAAELLVDLELGAGHDGVLAAYPDLVDDLVIDRTDSGWTHVSTTVRVADTLIAEPEAAAALAREMLSWAP